MSNLTLAVQKRVPGKAGKKDINPTDVLGVVYGKDVDSTPVAVDFNVLKKAFRNAGFNQILSLDLAGEKHEVLFKEVEQDPVSNEISHFDMYAIKRGEKVTIEVPVHIIGDSLAEQQGKNIVVFATSVEVTTIPSKIPEFLEVDQSALKEVDDTITVADIVTGDDAIEIITDHGTAIAKAEEVVEMQVEDADAEAVMPEAENGADAEAAPADGEDA